MGEERHQIEDGDLEELRGLEQETAKLRDELAETVIREENTKAQIEELQERLQDIEDRKEDVLSEIQNVDQKGRELARNLRQKYGQGQFDLESGEFIEKTSE